MLRIWPARSGFGSVRWKGLAVESLFVADVVDRVGDEVNRHDVDLLAFDTDRRHPRRKHVAQTLDHLEEVVRTVDFVHLAGAGVTDHDAGTVDPPRPLSLVSDDALGLVLGPEVGVLVEVFGLLEHVFAPGPLEQAGGGDRTGQVEAADLEPVGDLDRMHGAFDVGEPVSLVVGFHVVDRSQVVEVVDSALEILQVGVGDPQVRLGQVSDHGLDRAFGLTPAGDQLFEPPARALSHEHIHRAAPLQEALDQITADKAGSTSYEVIHRTSSRLAILVSRGCR